MGNLRLPKAIQSPQWEADNLDLEKCGSFISQRIQKEKVAKNRIGLNSACISQQYHWKGKVVEWGGEVRGVSVKTGPRAFAFTLMSL